VKIEMTCHELQLVEYRTKITGALPNLIRLKPIVIFVICYPRLKNRDNAVFSNSLGQERD
jgi:hypothetical protein